MRKLLFFAHKHSLCNLHRTNPHVNSAYIVQQLGSKHGTSHHFSYGQLNGRFNVADYTSSTAMEVHRPAASTPSASSTTAVTTTTTSRYRSTTRTTTSASYLRPLGGISASCSSQRLRVQHHYIRTCSIGPWDFYFYDSQFLRLLQQQQYLQDFFLYYNINTTNRSKHLAASTWSTQRTRKRPHDRTNARFVYQRTYGGIRDRDFPTATSSQQINSIIAFQNAPPQDLTPRPAEPSLHYHRSYMDYHQQHNFTTISPSDFVLLSSTS